MLNLHRRFSRRAVIAGAVALATAGAAGAATVHRMSITTGNGSGSSFTYLQSSSSGSALQGEVASSPNTNIFIPFGVLGEYNASPGSFGVGVLDISTTGYAIAGEAISPQPAILALNGSTGMGLEASSNTGSSAAASAFEAKGSGDGVDSFADGAGYGVFSKAKSGGVAVVGQAMSGGIGFLGAPTGEGVVAYGYSGGSTYPALSAHSQAGGTDLLGTFGSNSNETFVVQAGSGNRSGHSATNGSDVQVSGDLYVSGKVYFECNAFPAVPNGGSASTCSPATGGSASTGGATQRGSGAAVSTVRSSGGSDTVMYGASQSLPTVEDFGETRLVNGAAHVALDPAFARTMSFESPYLVFITPSGESRGLYVANRTPQGFDVHENGSGRSNITFDFRIVARPYADRSQRLATATSTRVPAGPVQPNAAAERQRLAALRDGSARPEPPAVRDLMSPAGARR